MACWSSLYGIILFCSGKGEILGFIIKKLVDFVPEMSYVEIAFGNAWDPFAI